MPALGSQAAAGDAALEQTWFAAYNLAGGGLGVLSAVLAFTLSKRWGAGRWRRWLLAAAALAASGSVEALLPVQDEAQVTEPTGRC